MLTYSIQFVELNPEQLKEAQIKEQIPQNLAAYIADYDGALTHEEYNSLHYSYRLFLSANL